MSLKSNKQVVARNRSARYNYDISKTFTSGVVLKGYEVKSVRAGNVDLKDSYVRIINDEPLIIGAYISKWNHSDLKDYDPKRSRKLLLKKSEIKALLNFQEAKKMSIVPMSVFFEGGKAKILLGVGKGRKKYDKREKLKKKDQKKQLQHELAGKKYF